MKSLVFAELPKAKCSSPKSSFTMPNGVCFCLMSRDVAKGFVTSQLSRFILAHQLFFKIVGTHVA